MKIEADIQASNIVPVKQWNFRHSTYLHLVKLLGSTPYINMINYIQ